MMEFDIDKMTIRIINRLGIRERQDLIGRRIQDTRGNFHFERGVGYGGVYVSNIFPKERAA